jgi:hypothetical protein
MITEQEVAKLEKWRAVIDHPDLPKITDPHKRFVTAMVLENTERDLREAGTWGPGSQRLLGEAAIPANFMGASSSTAGAGGIDTFDPILISMVRRSVPNLIAYDLVGVQPMTGPTGLIFAMRVRASTQTGAEQWYNEVNTALSTVQDAANTIGHKMVGSLPGNTTSFSNVAANGMYNFAGAMSTAQGEALGTDSNTAFPEMAFSIEKVTATAGSRALRATYTMELAQDLKAIHGMDAESTLSNMLTTEIMSEINREIIRTINIVAKPGAQTDTATAGLFDLDVDSNGRWSVEKFKGMHFFIDRECNQIARDTRRGKGNIMLCTSDVASALQAAKVLDYTPEMAAKLGVDDTGSTFVGIIGSSGPQGVRVFIDPYASGGQYMTVGFKGPTPMDAGLFYCPYVPLQMVRAVDPSSYQPSIGFKTRYAVVANPFAEGLTKGSGALDKDSNVYYRRIIVTHLM